MSQTGARHFLFVLALLIRFSFAQEATPYFWGFNSETQEASNTLTTCEDHIIDIVDGRDASGVSTPSTGSPPYAVLAYAVNGTPRAYDIGPGADGRLVWKSDYPVGTTLVLQVVDSKHQSGGFEPRFFTTVAGSSSSCIRQDSPLDFNDATAFTITANVTKPSLLGTCEPWGITAHGGAPPYTFTLFALDAPSLPNVLNASTVHPTDDTMVWVNRIDPGRVLMVAASDSTGRSAYGLPLVHTEGSTDTNCNSASTGPTFLDSRNAASFTPSTSSPSSAVPQSTDTEPSGDQPDEAKKTVPIIIAVPIVVIALALVIFFWFVFQRGKRRLHTRDMTMDSNAHQGPVVANSRPSPVLDLEQGRRPPYSPLSEYADSPSLYKGQSICTCPKHGIVTASPYGGSWNRTTSGSIASTSQTAGRGLHPCLGSTSTGPQGQGYYVMDIRPPTARVGFAAFMSPPRKGRRRAFSDTEAQPRISPPPSYCSPCPMGIQASRPMIGQGHKHAASLSRIDVQILGPSQSTTPSRPLPPIPGQFIRVANDDLGRVNPPLTKRIFDSPISSSPLAMSPINNSNVWNVSSPGYSEPSDTIPLRTIGKARLQSLKGKGRPRITGSLEGKEPSTRLHDHDHGYDPSTSSASVVDLQDPLDLPPRYQSPQSFSFQLPDLLATR